MMLAITSFAGGQAASALSPSGTYTNGQATAKIGLKVKVVDENGNGVAGVTLTAIYEEEEIKIGPSDTSGIAQSDPEAFQLYYRSANVIDHGSYQSSVRINRHVLSSPLKVSVTDWPAGYEKPCFRK